MKVIHIEIKPFLELLKKNEQSMWDIFAQLLTNEPQRIIFLNEKKEVDFHYILPDNLAQLKKDQAQFSKAFKEKFKNKS